MDPVKCPVCGKSFIPAPENVFRTTIRGRVKHLCSWKCFRKQEKKQSSKGGDYDG